MTIPFRHHHIFSILNSYEGHNLPLDGFLRLYFQDHKQLGSKDRKEICSIIYGMIRNRSLLDALSPSPLSWEKRLLTYMRLLNQELSIDPALPPHIRLSFPKNYFNLLLDNFGEQTEKICSICNEEAPITIRVNTLKISRDALFQKWEGIYPIEKCKKSDTGIIFLERMPLFSFPEFKEGLFEVQDEGSQLIATLVKPSTKDWVLDYCAGAGGKALTIAPHMQNKGQLFLHDIRINKLFEAKKRLKRAGVQNSQLLMPPIKPLERKMDWILVDAPCSGSGTLRRNPDMKWRFSQEAFDRLIQEQRTIFKEALQYLKPGGKIVYATCSVFKQENLSQLEFFLSQFPVKLHAPPLALLPESRGHDGFWGAVFELSKPLSNI